MKLIEVMDAWGGSGYFAIHRKPRVMDRAIFKDREGAGRWLAIELEHYRGSDAIVLGIPRGGVVVGHAVAKALDLPLDIVLSKKIGHPLNREFAIGSVSMDSVILDKRMDVPRQYVRNEVARIRERLREQSELYRGGRPPLPIKGRTAIIVDDGIATGNTLLSTIDVLRKTGPARIVVAVPVVPRDRVRTFQEAVDEFVYLLAPDYFQGVGSFYEEFNSTTDEEVTALLQDSRGLRMAS